MKTEFYFKKTGGDKWECFDGVTMVYVLQKMPAVAQEPPEGNGTERTPWMMKTVGQWAGAAQQVIAPRPSGPGPTAKTAEEILKMKQEYRGDLYVIGGQIIERNP